MGVWECESVRVWDDGGRCHYYCIADCLVRHAYLVTGFRLPDTDSLVGMCRGGAHSGPHRHTNSQLSGYQSSCFKSGGESEIGIGTVDRISWIVDRYTIIDPRYTTNNER
jgi:hypothetical protein